MQKTEGLGSGTYGCVIRPDLACSSIHARDGLSENSVMNLKKRGKPYVSKLFSSNSSRLEEWDLSQAVRKAVDPEGKYFLLPDVSCEGIPKSASDLQTCNPNFTNIYKTRQLLPQLLLPFGGKDLSHSAGLKIPISVIFHSLTNVFEGIALMNEKGLLHKDIKTLNILHNNGVSKIIDLGLMCSFGNHRYPGVNPFVPSTTPYFIGPPEEDMLFDYLKNVNKDYTRRMSNYKHAEGVIFYDMPKMAEPFYQENGPANGFQDMARTFISNKPKKIVSSQDEEVFWRDYIHAFASKYDVFSFGILVMHLLMQYIRERGIMDVPMQKMNAIYNWVRECLNPNGYKRWTSRKAANAWKRIWGGGEARSPSRSPPRLPRRSPSPVRVIPTKPVKPAVNKRKPAVARVATKNKKKPPTRSKSPSPRPKCNSLSDKSPCTSLDRCVWVAPRPTRKGYCRSK
jgi:serine/threonine protein kinase